MKCPFWAVNNISCAAGGEAGRHQSNRPSPACHVSKLPPPASMCVYTAKEKGGAAAPGLLMNLPSVRGVSGAAERASD